jgi:hypothetical protein
MLHAACFLIDLRASSPQKEAYFQDCILTLHTSSGGSVVSEQPATTQRILSCSKAPVTTLVSRRYVCLFVQFKVDALQEKKGGGKSPEVGIEI